ncbi:MAG: IclR family transcriptional regulator [Anaerolineae bacterium]|nr:IclR family transcriptional regulator [Anaerolineae bacterium]
MQREKAGLSTLDRICDILNAFNENQKVLTLTEISRQLKLPKSTIHRFIAALVSHDLLHHAPDGNGYQLGYQLIHWGALAQSSIALHERAIPILHELSEKTGETSVLSIRDGFSAIWLDQVESRQPVRWAKRVGMRVMLHAGASSKVLWAFLPDSEIEEILAHIDLVQLQPNTITDKDKMRSELKRIRRQGYATSYEETDRGAMGVAAPVFDYSGRLAAGIGIIAPINRMPAEEMERTIPIVLEAANKLSRQLGAP